jgi:putative hemolysin
MFDTIASLKVAKLLLSEHYGDYMKELPTPTIDLSPATMPRGSLHQRTNATNPTSLESISERGQISVTWARHLDEVRAAQKLRYSIFVDEMGARINSPLEGHDIDSFDDFCEHLIVRDQNTNEVVGTYRVLTPVQAKRMGGNYTETEFDLSGLRDIQDRMVELGRSCVHPDYRQGSVILSLWGALAEFMVRNQLDIMIGCASIPMLHNGVVSGQAAASIWSQLKETHMVPVEQQVKPWLALPVEQFTTLQHVDPPALIRGYLKLGAKVLGAPAWDPDFNTADLPMLMRICDLPSRYRKHFLGH